MSEELELSIIKDIKNYKYSELTNDFFSLAVNQSEKKEIIVNFLKKHSTEYSSFHDYEAFNSILCTLPLQNREYGTDILKFFLDSTPTLQHAAYCVTNIIMTASQNPEAYTGIIQKLKEVVSANKDTLEQEFNDFFIWQDNVKEVQKYLKEQLDFKPINETLPLIDSSIDGVSSTINDILKKVRTDCAPEERELLKTLLIKDLTQLTDNKTIDSILQNASKYADIYIYKSGDGGGYAKSKLENKPVICLSGASGYINKININLVTGLVHEATHLSLDIAFKNNSKPFESTNKSGEELWGNFAKSVIESLRSASPPPQDMKELMRCVDTGYNEFSLLSYMEDDYTKELPAFLIQEIVIRKLTKIERGSIILELDKIGIMDFLSHIINNEANSTSDLTSAIQPNLSTLGEVTDTLTEMNYE